MTQELLTELSKRKIAAYAKKAVKSHAELKKAHQSAINAHKDSVKKGDTDGFGRLKSDSAKWGREIGRTRRKKDNRERGIRTAKHLLNTKKDGKVATALKIGKKAAVATGKFGGRLAMKAGKAVVNAVKNRVAGGFYGDLKRVDETFSGDVDAFPLTETYLTELSKKALGGYMKKAIPNRDAHQRAYIHHSRDADSWFNHSRRTDDPDSKSFYQKEWDRAERRSARSGEKARKRTKGMINAIDKLTKEDVSHDGEPLMELSKKTLASYVKKADKQAERHLKISDRHEDKAMSTDGDKYPVRQQAHNDIAKAFFLKARKRMDGIKAAKTKLAK
jgi:hypothetical protein